MLPIRVGAYRAESHETENARYGTPLVFVHGLWTGAWIWRAFGSFLAHRGWEAIAVDLRGRPDSRPSSLASVGIADYVEDLLDVLSRRKKARPVLVGHGVGAVVALAAAADFEAAAVVALAPPLPGALLPDLRRQLERRRGWLDRRVPPPSVETATTDGTFLIADSPRVAREVLRGHMPRHPRAAPVLVVGGEDDPYVDTEALESTASAREWSFARRPARHWDLDGRGFERQVDPIHRWLVRELGGANLRLTGLEDLEDDEEEEDGR